MARITIRSVRPAPHGFNENTLCLASIAIVIEAHDEPIELTRWQPGKNGAEGKEYKRGSISAGVLRLEDVSINKWTNRGGDVQHYASANGFKWDRSISDVIAADALRLFKDMPRGGVAPSQQPVDQYDTSGDPFEAAAEHSAPAGNRPH